MKCYETPDPGDTNMEPHGIHHDRYAEAANRAREELTRAVRQAAETQRFLTRFGVDLNAKKIEGIKLVREKTGLGLKEAKDAWELAYELRAA